MKSNLDKEETADTKKKYVFFSDPDVIVRRAESTAATSQALQNFKVQEQERRSNPKVSQSGPKNSLDYQTKSDLKGLETLLSYHPVQPYPFTFITAVKRKLALSMHAEACKRAYEPERLQQSQTDVHVNKSNTDFTRSVNQAAQKMDFIKPLKVPDLKISPKPLDYSQRESFVAKDIILPSGSLSSKYDIEALDEVSLAINKSPKNCEKVHRKLDFSVLEGSSIKNCENIEPLKAPDLSIGSSFGKKNQHARDISREKENRSKRIKKDDSGLPRKDDDLNETPKRPKSVKHQSRKDVDEETESMFEMFKPENFLSAAPRESDFGFKKVKSKNFLTSTVKKHEDRRHRSTSMQSARSAREQSLESKIRNYDNDSNSEKNMKVHERNTVRDIYRGKPSEIPDHVHNISNQDIATLRQGDDYKYKNPEPSSSRHQKHSVKVVHHGQIKLFENHSKTQIKKSYEKQKSSISESETEDLRSDISEDIKTGSDSITGLKDAGNLSGRIDSAINVDDGMINEVPLHQSKCNEGSRQAEQSCRNTRSSSQIEKCYENPEKLSHTENLLSLGTNTGSKTIVDSINQIDSNTSSPQNKSNSELKNSQSQSFSGIHLDPTRISFRDESLEAQNEFCDLVTPDINLLPRSKRRKNFTAEEDTETDLESAKHGPANKTQSKDDGIQLLHPTALHMQFQAELHLLDSFNESLRQVMDVENCLYNAKHEEQQEFLLKQKENEIRRKNLMLTHPGRDTVDIERHRGMVCKSQQETIEKNEFIAQPTDKKDDAESAVIKTSNDNAGRVQQSQGTTEDTGYSLRKNDRISVRVTEVQTQTANDIATQTETPRIRRRHNSPGRQMPGITYQRGSTAVEDIPQLSLESLDAFEDLDEIENVSLPSRMHTMSEISLHETTSSIRTETGTEISISTRDVTCSFNKYLDSELAQLIKDEKQRYDEIEMLFKSREKTLNDRTKKLVKLEEQKRALRDMGQDSRISSVKKKQRALLLKLQQEKDEMNRLKELHKKASQERKLMLQKQRNMLNPQMSTKNILTKLKRSADSQSPRRLSGPMKGYDIRSPSSMSSLVDSDKSQIDRSHLETKSQIPDARLHKSEGRIPRSVQEGQDKLLRTDQFDNMMKQSEGSLIDSNVFPDSQKFITKQQKAQITADRFEVKSKYETKPCKYKETIPRVDISHYKSHGSDFDSDNVTKKSIKSDTQTLEKTKSKELQQKQVSADLDKSITENIKSESDTLVDDFCKKSKSSKGTDVNLENLKLKREKDPIQKNIYDLENLNAESESIAEELGSKKSKSSQVTDDISDVASKTTKKVQNVSVITKEALKKSQNNAKIKSNSKRKGSRSVKSKSSSDILSENVIRSKSSSQISEEIAKHHSKRSKLEKDEVQSEQNYENSLVHELDANESQSSLHALVKHSRAVKEKNYQLLRNIANEYEAKENLSRKDLENLRSASERNEGNLKNVGNVSTRSQVSTLTISHHSSGESEKSYSRSVVIRAQDHHFRTSKKLEQILSAREAALASRRSCVEEWIAWHSRLRAEESRVARMEEAAFKLVSAASNALSYHDATVSSDTSDVESRIEVLAEKLAERRTEMARLKREAKRQAKQRLKALETNLLNQIKKYDTTIHEMRKKLEIKRGAVFHDDASEKLAIESKSLTDFKIPDIPIKRIKEIYENSDLLKSRSESELRTLISESDQRKDLDKIYKSEHSAHDTRSCRKSPKSTINDVTDLSEISNSDRKATTQSIQSIFEDNKSPTTREPDFNSENSEVRSISEDLETNSYARSSHNKSKDEIWNISTISKSDLVMNETQLSRVNEICNEIIISNEERDIHNGTRPAISHTETLPVGASETLSRPSLYQESISENIQKSSTLQEAESESIQTAPEVKTSRSSDISIQESISKYVSSEVLSNIGEYDPECIIEYNRSVHSTSNNVTNNDGGSEKSGGNKFEEFPEIAKTAHLEQQSNSNSSKNQLDQTKESAGYNVYKATSRLTNKESPEHQQTSPDNASVTEVSSIDEIDMENNVEKSESISNKLSFLELGNKNLNNDISTLENDLKALSEMMSQFSKNSDGKLRSEETLRDADNVIYLSDIDKETSNEITDLDCANDADDKEIVSQSDCNATYILTESHDVSALHNKDLTAQVTEIMMKIMPEHVSPLPDLNQEIDFKARSREILNEIEKSIISEHAKSPDCPSINVKTMETNALSLENKNYEVIDDLKSLDNDIISIAQIISNASEAKKDIKMIQSLGNDHLFEDESSIMLSVNSRQLPFGDREIIVQSTETGSYEIPILHLPDESNEDENTPRSSDEITQLEESCNATPAYKNNKNMAKDLSETLEQNELMFETIKDPEYEDISEESLEVSEIMDRSESQRSNSLSYRKSSRLPEKYQVTQKSEDVLRILDEITQKSNEVSQTSQQLPYTLDNRGTKIHELLQRSEGLSQNFEALTKKPTQLDFTLNEIIAIPQKANEKSVAPPEILPQLPKSNSTNIILSQPLDTIVSMKKSPHESDCQKSANVLHDTETSILDGSRSSSEMCADTDAENQLLNFNEEQMHTRTECELESVTHKQSGYQSQETKNQLGVCDTNTSQTWLPRNDENVNREKLQDCIINEKPITQIHESSVDIAFNKSDNVPEKSEKSTASSEQLSQGPDEIAILSEPGQTNIISQYKSVRDELNGTLTLVEASNTSGLDEISPRCDRKLEKSDVHSYNIDILIQVPEIKSPHSRCGINALQKCEDDLPDLEQQPQETVEESRSMLSVSDGVSHNGIGTLQKLEELNALPELLGHTIHELQDALQNVEEIPELTDLSQELYNLSPNHEETSCKGNATEKSDCVSQKSDESQPSEKSEDILQKYEVDLPSESSEEIDTTPRSVSEIEMDSPRDPNDSRLDIEGLDDDLLGNDYNYGSQNIELRTEFHATPAIATSEKDIEAMIEKLKVSLEQPGLDVAELEAKLLRIQQLQIELEIKKLEAEEVSYYVREIPNKPPPPYTPPSGGRLSISQASPSPAPAVVPTNVEDLTLFTEKATHLIYQAKQSGDDIINLEPPIEICELSKDNNETARRDRKIYNTFLFDLCKETISEVYQSEYEKPGPSWLKPNAKTKPTLKIPKTVEGLNDYVSKEVATLFGFKTKLQRENLVMRWSRKRRDRVDELLAREAQAEEDEWTKFHQDELAVKNELTTAILDSLILDAANVVKMAYIKKRKVTS